MVDFGELGPGEVERIDSLLEREQVLGPPGTLEAFRDLLGAGLDSGVPAGEA